MNAALAWLSLARHIFFFVFPPLAYVDVLGSVILQVAALPLRTWVAFCLAGFTASFVTSHILLLISSGAEMTVEETGAVHPENRADAQTLSLLILEFYLLPRIYDAIAASRDETMYEAIVAQSRQSGAKRMVAVVGGAHANGILSKARQRGL